MSTYPRRALAMALLLAAGGVATNAATVQLDLSQRYQTIEGFGAHMLISPWTVKSGPFYITVDLEAKGIYDSIVNELGATLLRTFIPPEFQPSQGVFVRSELSGRIANMRRLLAAAERHAEPIEFFTSCFSPPGWMKVGGVAACGVEAAPPLSQTTCKLSIGMEQELATHFEAGLRTFLDSTGYELFGLSIQNEPAFSEPYVSCVYDGPRYRDVLKVVAGQFRAHGLQTRFIGSEHMGWAFPSQFEQAIRQDPAALGYMYAWAVHGYSDGVQTDTGAYAGTTPTDKPLWMTETQGPVYGTSLLDWGGAMTLGGNILRQLRDARITAWVWGQLQNVCGAEGCEATSGEGHLIVNGTPSAKYYASRHFYRFVRPGARQIASTCDDGQLDVVAFYHEANNCWTVVIRNGTSSTKTVNLAGAGIPAEWLRETSTDAAKRVTATVPSSGVSLPPMSLTTLVAGQYMHTGTTSTVRPRRSSPSTRALQTMHAVPVDVSTYSLTGRRVLTRQPGASLVVSQTGLRAVAIGSPRPCFVLRSGK